MNIDSTLSTNAHMRATDDHVVSNNDPIKAGLEAVTQKLYKPSFLKNISASRLPSQAASDCSSISPEPTKTTFAAAPTSRPLPSNLAHFIDFSSRGTRIEAAHLLVLDYLSHGSAAQLTINHKVCQELERSFLIAHSSGARMNTERGFQSFTSGHQDLVLAVDFDYFGSRMVTASSDHNLKVWDRKDESWTLVDSWKAHDAEVVDVKWSGPYSTPLLASISEDGRLKLWSEDPLELPTSHRRFKQISTLLSETRVPFMSLSFKNIFQDTFLALITRDGHLTVYEPDDPNTMTEWKKLAPGTKWDEYVCPTTERSRESSCRVAFHKEKLPCWTAIMAGLPRTSLSLAVAAQESLTIFRTDRDRRPYIAASVSLETPGQQGKRLIRDVAWANGSMRGYDVVALACKDGIVRVYEVTTPGSDHTSYPKPSHDEKAEGTASPRPTHRTPAPRSSAPQQSGIGAGLADAGKSHHGNVEDTNVALGRIKQEAKLVAELSGHKGAVWRVSFSPMGDLLVSTGDDGVIRTWKKAISAEGEGGRGRWLEYAEIEAGKDV